MTNGPDMLKKALSDNGVMILNDGGVCDNCVIFEPCQKDAEDKKRVHKAFRQTCTEDIGKEHILINNANVIENKEEFFQLLLTISNIGAFHS